MKKAKNIFGMLCLMGIIISLVGCSNEDPSTSNSEENIPSAVQEISMYTACKETADTSDKDSNVNFTYYYHGFLIESTDGSETLVPTETYIIDTVEEYEAFFSAYNLGSIYQLDSVDFDKDCLVYTGFGSAQGVRGWSQKIQEVWITDTEIDFVLDETINFGKENEDEAVAYQMIGAPNCAVREIFFLTVEKEALPESLRDAYQPMYNG